MSNTGVNAGFAKCFICFMALMILLQGLIYLGLAIWGIKRQECSQRTSDITENPFKFVVDLIYFLDEDCGEPSIKASDKLDAIEINVNWGDSDKVTNRTFIFLIAYAAISGLWIITSMLVVTTICGRVTKVVKALCLWPWFLVIIAGCILDGIATGYHIKDIIHTTSVDKAFEYLGLSTSKVGMDILHTADAYFITPSVVMTCLSSRIALMWLFNIFGSSFSLSLANSLSKRNSSSKSSVTSAATTVTAPLTTPQVQPTPRQEGQYNQELSEQLQPVNQRIEEPTLIRPKPLIIQSVLPSNNNFNRIHDVQSPSAPSPNSVATANDSVTYRNTDSLNYHRQQPRSPQPQQSLEALSPISPLNSRYSTVEGLPHAQHHNQRVSEELRGQLPWSYTSRPPPTPKKPEMKVYPEIPEPDYGN